MNFLTLKPEAFGLDISDLALKIIKLKKKGKFLSLASFGEYPIKSGIIEGGEIKNAKALIKNIKESLTKIKGEKLNTKYAVVSLPEEKTFLQVIQLPIMKEEELKKAVYFEAENYVPLPIDNVYLDSQIVSPVHNHLDHLDVLIVAMPKKVVDPYVFCLQKAGLRPKVLEIESQAISRALIKNEFSQKPIVLLDIGETRASCIIFSGHSLKFTSSCQVSSQKFTDAISKTLKVSLKEAEKLKIEHGIQTNKKSNKVSEALIPVLTDLAEQIKKYLSYYQTHASHEHLPPGGKKIKKLYLCGGGANLKGLCEFLSLELKLPVECGNPWANILPKPLKEVPELPYQESLKYTTALGLALQGVARRPQGNSPNGEKL